VVKAPPGTPEHFNKIRMHQRLTPAEKNQPLERGEHLIGQTPVCMHVKKLIG